MVPLGFSSFILGLGFSTETLQFFPALRHNQIFQPRMFPETFFKSPNFFQYHTNLTI